MPAYPRTSQRSLRPLNPMPRAQWGAVQIALHMPMPRLQPQRWISYRPRSGYMRSHGWNRISTRTAVSAGRRARTDANNAGHRALYCRNRSNLARALSCVIQPTTLRPGAALRFAYLAEQDGIAGNLIRMLAAYNSGPGSFRALEQHAARQRRSACCSSRRSQTSRRATSFATR